MQSSKTIETSFTIALFSSSFASKIARTTLTLEQRTIIVNLQKSGKKEREIAPIVERPRSTVNATIKRFCATGTAANRPRSGRPTKVTDRFRTAIIRDIKINPSNPATTMVANISGSLGVQLHPQTVRNVLHKDGYNGRACNGRIFIAGQAD